MTRTRVAISNCSRAHNLYRLSNLNTTRPLLQLEDVDDPGFISEGPGSTPQTILNNMLAVSLSFFFSSLTTDMNHAFKILEFLWRNQTMISDIRYNRVSNIFPWASNTTVIMFNFNVTPSENWFPAEWGVPSPVLLWIVIGPLDTLIAWGNSSAVFHSSVPWLNRELSSTIFQLMYNRPLVWKPNTKIVPKYQLAITAICSKERVPKVV